MDPGFRRGPRPWGLGGGVVSGFRRNDGGLGAGVHVPSTLRLSQWLAAVWSRRAVPEGWGRVDSGFRRKDGGWRPYSVSPAKAGVHVPGGRGAAWFPAFAGMTGGWGPGSTSLTRFGCLSGWPPSGVDALSLRVGGAWIPAFAGKTGVGGPTPSPRRKPGVHVPGGRGAAWFPAFAGKTGRAGRRAWQDCQSSGWRVDSGFRRKDG